MHFTASLLTFAALAVAAQSKCVTSYGSQSLSSVPTVKSSTTVTTTKLLTSTLIPTSTITPTPVTSTTTKTKTKNVSAVTGSTFTDTVSSTITSTSSTSVTTFVASTSTVVVTTTSAQTSITVPTAAGFTGVGDYLVSLGHTYSKKKKRNALAYDAPALVGRATSGFPTQVSCSTTVKRTATSTVTVTGTSTSTITAPAKTSTLVITSTVTATKTKAPVHVTTTADPITTTTTTTSVVTFEVLADYTTTTTTITASSTTVYAACTGTYNLVSAVDGGMITDAHNLHGSYSTSDSNAFDCCNHCQSLGADCWTGGFYKGTCWLNSGDGTGVCSVDSFNGDFYYCAGCAPDGESAVTVFNSACGRTEFGGDAQ